MSTNYEAPYEVRTLEKMLSDFSYNNGYDISQVFDDTLRYIIHGFSLDGNPIDNWHYKKEQTMFFWKYLQEWIKIMDKQILLKEWYDPFGDLFMSCTTSQGKQSQNSQFFTPIEICNFMAIINQSKEKVTGQRCLDPTCGSGRLLLAWHVNNLGNYLCAEDLDKTCCLMTCCNFLIHGCVGEVIWHNSLLPDSWFYGWKINENLNNPFSKYFGISHIRSIQKEESCIIKHRQFTEEKNSNNIPVSDTKNIKSESKPSEVKRQQPIQLTLF